MRRPTFRQPCGCTHDGHRWIDLCEQHERESRELHERAAREHRASCPAEHHERAPTAVLQPEVQR